MLSRKKREQLLEKAVAEMRRKLGPVIKPVQPNASRKIYHENKIMQDDYDQEWHEQNPEGISKGNRS